jgi:hypothetical protein
MLSPAGSVGLDEQDVAAPPDIVDDVKAVIATFFSKLTKEFVNVRLLGACTVQLTWMSIVAVELPLGFVDVIVYVLLGE